MAKITDETGNMLRDPVVIKVPRLTSRFKNIQLCACVISVYIKDT